MCGWKGLRVCHLLHFDCGGHLKKDKRNIRWARKIKNRERWGLSFFSLMPFAYLRRLMMMLCVFLYAAVLTQQQGLLPLPFLLPLHQTTRLPSMASGRLTTLPALQTNYLTLLFPLTWSRAYINTFFSFFIDVLSMYKQVRHKMSGSFKVVWRNFKFFSII